MAISEDVYIRDSHFLPYPRLQADHHVNENMVLHFYAWLAKDGEDEMYDDHEQSERSEKNEEVRVPWIAKQARDCFQRYYFQNGFPLVDWNAKSYAGAVASNEFRQVKTARRFCLNLLSYLMKTLESKKLKSEEVDYEEEVQYST